MLKNLHARIVVPFTILVAVNLAIFAWMTWRHLGEDVASNLQGYTRGLSRMLVQGLKESMRRNDREHLRRMIEDVGGLEWVLDVTVVNKEGVISFASDPADRGRSIPRVSETCQACHRSDPPPLTLTTVTSQRYDVGSILRASEVIRVEEECQECHGLPAGKALGVLIVDLDMGPLVHDVKERASRNLLLLTLGSAVLLAILVLVVRGVVVERLHRLSDIVAALRSGSQLPLAGRSRGDEIDELKRALTALRTDIDDRQFSVDVTRLLERNLNGMRFGILFLDAGGAVLLANDAAQGGLSASFGEIAGRTYADLDETRRGLWERSRKEEIVGHPAGRSRGADGYELVLMTLVDDDGDPIAYLEVGRTVEGEGEGAPVPGGAFPGELLRSPFRPPEAGGDHLFRAVTLSARLSTDSLGNRKIIELDRTIANGHQTFARLLSIRSVIDEQVAVCNLGEIVTDVVADLRRAHPEKPGWHTLFSGPTTQVGHPVLIRQLVLGLVEMAAERAAGEAVVFVQHQLHSPRFFLGVWMDGSEIAPPEPLRWSLCSDISSLLNGSLEFDPSYSLDGLSRAHPDRVLPPGDGGIFIGEFPYSHA